MSLVEPVKRTDGGMRCFLPVNHSMDRILKIYTYKSLSGRMLEKISFMRYTVKSVQTRINHDGNKGRNIKWLY